MVPLFQHYMLQLSAKIPQHIKHNMEIHIKQAKSPTDGRVPPQPCSHAASITCNGSVNREAHALASSLFLEFSFALNFTSLDLLRHAHSVIARGALNSSGFVLSVGSGLNLFQHRRTSGSRNTDAKTSCEV
jgi:hypothetical protein